MRGPRPPDPRRAARTPACRRRAARCAGASRRGSGRGAARGRCGPRRPARMKGRAEVEMLRTLKGPSTGEVSVHLVPRGSPGPGPHLPTAAFIIPASSATLGLPSGPLEVSCSPREPIHVGAPQRVPVTATVRPQRSAGPAARSGARTARLRGRTEAEAPAPRPGGRLRSRRREPAPRTMVGAEQPPSPELRREAVAEYGAGQAPAGGGDAGAQQRADLPQDPPGDAPRDRPESGATCQCQACEPPPGSRPDAGASRDGCPCPPRLPERPATVESPSGQKPHSSTSELLKPVKKRKYREYHSPSEESEPDALEKREERKDPEGQPAASIPESEEWNGGQPASGEKEEGWSWESYLKEQKAITAPVSLFQDYQTVPQNKNGFRSGMKLEGIDPQHPSLYFILTVAEVCGYRLRLHFDGYSECHDFWVNANSPDIHPAGWFEKTGHTLQLPTGYEDEDEFSWSEYLRCTRAQAAPKHLFVSQRHSSLPLGFQVGRKLEAVDRMNPSLVCVASVSDVVGSRFLVHFDNWDDTYDYWCDASSPYIHPVGWCQKHGKPLTPPQDYPDPDSFCWEKYLEETRTTAVPSWAFKVRPPHGFLVNMKLEAVDRRNPSLIRVASVEDVEDHRIKLHFDGWSHAFDFWIDADHPDIHPAGWCSKTGHPLQPPLHPRELGSASPESCLPLSYWGLPHTRTSKYSFHHRKCPTPGCDGSGHITALTPDVIHQSFFMSSLSAHPDRYLSVCWEQHCKLLPGVAGISASTVAKWTIDEVFGFVQTLTGCEDQAQVFKDEMIDGEAFLLLTQADIVKIMSVKLGPALKIYNAILMFKNADDTLK